MSHAARLLNEAASRAAAEGVRKLKIDRWTAERLSPVAVSLVLFGLKRNTVGVAGAAYLSFMLNRYREDLLAREHRLADPDIRARGENLLDDLFGGNLKRAVTALAELAGIDSRQSQGLLAMTAPGVISALARARRELQLNAMQVQGVIKSETADIDRTDPQLVRDLRDWVFRPSIVARLWRMISYAVSLPFARPRMAPAE
jgi:hypothetical protein